MDVCVSAHLQNKRRWESWHWRVMYVQYIYDTIWGLRSVDQQKSLLVSFCWYIIVVLFDLDLICCIHSKELVSSKVYCQITVYPFHCRPGYFSPAPFAKTSRPWRSGPSTTRSVPFCAYEERPKLTPLHHQHNVFSPLMFWAHIFNFLCCAIYPSYQNILLGCVNIRFDSTLTL